MEVSMNTERERPGMGRWVLAGVLAVAALGLATPAPAADGRTPGGKVSIAAVAEALAKSDKDEGARDRVIAFVSGSVEAAVAMNERAAKAGHPLFCKKGEGKLDGPGLIDAFHRAAPDESRWGEADAASAIVDHLIRTLPCG
jgi:hypothetical protein